jgi:hypothetical protein
MKYGFETFTIYWWQIIAVVLLIIAFVLSISKLGKRKRLLFSTAYFASATRFDI